jgi:hypothetical protein
MKRMMNFGRPRLRSSSAADCAIRRAMLSGSSGSAKRGSVTSITGSMTPSRVAARSRGRWLLLFGMVPFSSLPRRGRVASV